MTMTLRTAAIGLVGLALTACGGGNGGSGPAGPHGPAPEDAALARAVDCDELLTAFQNDARARIRVQADQLRANGWVYAGAGGPTPVATFAPTAMPTASPAAGGPRSVTDTNTQVAGVDEPDVVETDGDRLYLLQDAELLVLTASPPAATAIADRVTIEGAPTGMFVAHGRALVFSDVVDDGRLGGSSRCNGIGAPFPIWRAKETGFAPPIVPCQALFTKLTLIDVTTSPARVLRELYVEGHDVTARRHETRARVIVERPWSAPVAIVDPWSVLWIGTPPATAADFAARVDGWERDALAAIDDTAIHDWLPASRERRNGALVEQPIDCAAAEIPPAAHAQEGSTSIVGLDLTAADAPVDDVLFLGDASEVYADADTLVLGHPEWQAEPLGDTATRTALHVFALTSDAPGVVYRGSGFVPGTVLSQFALDVRADVVRVATDFAPASGGPLVTRVTTARIEDGALATLGASPDLAPGEQLRAVRFLGDRAYVGTFFQVDPLFVVDLTDPVHPRPLGSVEFPGFSEYLQPLDDDHLLTIGRNAGESFAVALRLFDVTDPTAPRETAEYDLPLNAVTPAETDHLAFTYDARLGLLALPVDVFDDLGTRATLDLFAVDPAGSIELHGTIDRGAPAPCLPPFESCQGSDSMRRGLFIDDAVYSISARSVQVHALDDLATPLATVPLR